MNIKAQQYLQFCLWSLFAICAVVSLVILAKAGCAGDIKSGALGNPLRALELEAYSIAPTLLSAGFGATAIILSSKSPQRAVYGTAFAVLVLICLWLAGVQIETLGVQSCF